MLRTRLTTEMWVDSLKIPQIVVFVWDQTAFLSVFREGKHPFGLQRKSQHFPSSVFTINNWSASRESSLALNQHFRVFSISAIPGRWQSKCDWQEKWKKQRQNRGCCQQALGGGNKSVQRMEGCRARPVLIIPKACQVLTLWQGSLEPSDGFPAPLIILGAVGRFLIPECKSLMWFCKQPVFAANSYADSLSHEIQEKNIGRPAAFAIRTSELALSFNPGFRWVSPIYSTNPHWNVTMHMSLLLRYESTQAASRVASRSRWTKLTTTSLETTGTKRRMGVGFIGVKMKTKTAWRHQAGSFMYLSHAQLRRQPPIVDEIIYSKFNLRLVEALTTLNFKCQPCTKQKPLVRYNHIPLCLCCCSWKFLKIFLIPILLVHES